ncbi:MAG: PhoH family protein [Inquilinus sp.]|nr:PhoH family protein [Inquilinus sp.]
MLYGEHDSNLARIEHQLGVTLSSRGNRVTIRGEDAAAQKAVAVLNALWERLEKGLGVGGAEIDAVVHMASLPPGDGAATAAMESFNRPENGIRTRMRLIVPRTVNQTAYIAALRGCELVFGLGPAGTGKTYLAVAQAVAMLTEGRVDRIILSRPAVEAGERLGFLPGDMREKVDPYLRPLYDALFDMLPADQVAKYLETGTIEVAPLAFMRGRTLSNAFVILDEAQNTTAMQMRMFLTRLGENGYMVVTGDPSQIDLPTGVRSGLRDAIDILEAVEGVGMVRLDERDVVRHHLVTRIVRAYETLDRKAREAREES